MSFACSSLSIITGTPFSSSYANSYITSSLVFGGFSSSPSLLGLLDTVATRGCTFRTVSNNLSDSCFQKAIFALGCRPKTSGSSVGGKLSIQLCICPISLCVMILYVPDSDIENDALFRDSLCDSVNDSSSLSSLQGINSSLQNRFNIFKRRILSQSSVTRPPQFIQPVMYLIASQGTSSASIRKFLNI